MRKGNSMALVLAPLLLSACYVGPVFKLKKTSKLACAEPLYTWGGGLTTHVLNGSGDGNFDYDPTSLLVDRMNGTYEMKTGDFWWLAEYHESSYREAEYANGFGTLWRDGDLDIEYDLQYQFGDGSVEEYGVRERRLGCEVNQITYDDADFPIEYVNGEFTDDGFEYTREFSVGNVVLVADGFTRDSLGYEEYLAYNENGAVVSYDEEGDGLGFVRRDFDQTIAGVTIKGWWERYVNGVLRVDYRVKRPSVSDQFWVYELDGQGDGTGTFSYDDQSCKIRMTAFECTLRNCSDDSLSGTSCVVPLDVPDPR